MFKVETIGDCYVAVVGLPTARKNHSAVMAKFARDCRNKMQELVVGLEETLGQVCCGSCNFHLCLFLIGGTQTCQYWTSYSHFQGTDDLSLRIGLNSGPTTAGVLRGDKSRFQLFGDVSSSFVFKVFYSNCRL